MIRGGAIGARPAAVLVLSLSTVAWGSTFFLAKPLVAAHDPLTLIALRFGLGALALIAARPRALLALPRAVWLRAAGLGLFYGLAQLPHYYGLARVPASAAGFLVGTYVVLTPALDLLLFGRRPSARSLVGVAAAAAGLAVFAYGDVAAGLGMALCLASAVLYALQISTMSAWSPGAGAWALTTIQMTTIALVVGAAAGVRGVDPPNTGREWLVIAYLALVAGALAVGAQTWAQQRIPAAQAAVIMAAEPLWAAVLAVAFTAETVTGRLLVGGGMLLVANVVIAQARSRPAAVEEVPSGG